jgi:hypothetical protein
VESTKIRSPRRGREATMLQTGMNLAYRGSIARHARIGDIFLFLFSRETVEDIVPNQGLRQGGQKGSVDESVKHGAAGRVVNGGRADDEWSLEHPRNRAQQ